MRSLRLLFEPQLNTRNAIGCCRILCSLPAAHLGQRQRLRISVPHIRRISTFCLLQRSERKGVTLNKNHNKILEPLTLQEIYSLECKKRRFSITVPICQMRKQSRDEIVEAAPRPQDGQLTVGQKGILIKHLGCYFQKSLNYICKCFFSTWQKVTFYSTNF